jgi:GNAT superfamily N-acetyltransferase
MSSIHAVMQETENIDLPLERIRPGVEAVLKDSSLGTYYILMEHHQVVAQLMITFEWSDWRNCMVWWIQSVYVPPQHRKKGHFKQLYKKVREAAAAAGAAGLRLYADADNHGAQRTVSQL